MKRIQLVTAAVAALSLAACNPFNRTPAVKVDPRDVNVNSRWQAQLASPANLAGVVHINGSATMTPGPTDGSTKATIIVSNATPGGVHPWQVHMGQCGTDQGVFGASDAYHMVTIDGSGNATSSATVGQPMPTDGSYFVSVGASSTNPETIVACGNFAAPSR